MRRLRVVRGFTQERLAELVDLNIRTLQKIEAGQINIRVTTVLRLHAALRCRWQDLLPADQLPPPDPDPPGIRVEAKRARSAS